MFRPAVRCHKRQLKSVLIKTSYHAIDVLLRCTGFLMLTRKTKESHLLVLCLV